MTVRIGLVGIGFMGTTHFQAISQIENAEVVAIATRDEKKWTGDWRDIQGNFGDGGGIQDLSRVAKYRTPEEMFEDPNVDLVDICLPTTLHKDTVISALKAGKDVIVEKPIALTEEDAKQMIRTAEETGRKLYVAHVLRFFPEYKLLHDVITGGAYGDVAGLTMKRVIGSAAWDEDAWLKSEDVSGGPIVDLLIHDVDFVHHTFGMPDRVIASGHITKGGHAPYYSVQLHYEDKNLSISINGGTVGMPARPFEQGYDLYLKDGFLQYNSTLCSPPTLISRSGEETVPPLSEEEPFVAQLGYAVEAVTGEVSGDKLTGGSAFGSLRICLAVKEAIRTGEAQYMKER